MSSLCFGYIDGALNEHTNFPHRHTGNRTLKVLKYHGQARERELTTLADADVVITTYSTLATESNKTKSQLHRIGWFRVVLDEGIFLALCLPNHQACSY